MAIPSSGDIDMKKVIMELQGTPYASAVASELETWDWNATVNAWSANSNSAAQPSNKYSLTDWAGYDHFAVASFTDDKSFDFDGTNDYLSTTTNLSSAIPVTSASVSCWVKLDSMSANGFLFQINAESGTNDQIILLWNNAAGKIRGNVKLNGSANIVDSGSGLENDGNWHHVVFTWVSGSKTSSNNIARLYIDGSQTDSDAISTTWGDASDPAHFTIGRNQIQSNAYFNGHINDYAIFNIALSSSQVSAIYNSGSPKDESSHTGLVAYYKMEGYSDNDSTLTDDSSNSYTLAINNSSNIDSTDTP